MSMMRINYGLTKPPGRHHGECGLKIAARWRKSGSRAQFVGRLNIGYDIRCLPNRPGFNRLQAHCPVSTPACTGHADDVKLDVPAHGMPLQGIRDAPPDFVECGWRFRRKPLEIHHASLFDSLAACSDCGPRWNLEARWLMAR